MEKHNQHFIHQITTSVICMLLLLTNSSLFAQKSEDFRVMVRRGVAWQPLPVDSLGIQVIGMGSQAQVIYEFNIYNPFNEVLEGQCLLPIANGTQVTGFALETEGEMREASVVDARLGRTAYESTVRKQIDPGLLEMLGPNIYKLRIFPLPATGFRKVRIETTVSLSLENGLLRLPIQVTKASPKVNLSLLWKGATGVPYVHNGPEMDFAESRNEIAGQWNGPARSWGEQPALVIPYQPNSGQIWKDRSGWAYMEVTAPKQKISKLDPDKVMIYWDQSGSMESFDRTKAIEILTDWFSKTTASTVEVIPFHLRMGNSRSFRTSGSVDAFSQFLNAIPADGASDWGSLNFDRRGIDQYIIVTDGEAFLGPSEFPTIKAPIFLLSTNAIVSAPGPYTGLALTSRGRSTGIDQDSPNIVADKLTSVQDRIIEIAGDESNTWWPLDFDASSGLYRFAGKIEETAESISFTIGSGSNKETIEVPLSVESSGAQPLSIERIWAQAKVNQYLYSPSPQEDQLAELGTKYRLVTPVTSLLVLERLDDYVTYQVEPPAHMKKDYDALVKAEKESWDLKLLSHLDEVAELYQARVTWWETEFKPRPVRKMKRDESDRETESGDDWTSEPAEDAYMDVEESRIEAVEVNSPSPTSADMGNAFGSEADADGIPDVYDEEPGEASSEESNPDAGREINISLNAWSSEASYIPVLERAGEEWFESYLSYKAQNETSPGFFIDVANWRWEAGDTLMAIQIIGNLAELSPGDHELLRTLARKLQQTNEPELAQRLFTKVLELRPEEPQSHRDLALVAAQQQQWQTAIDLLYDVVTTKWEDRFPEIGVMAAQEMNAIISQSDQKLNLTEIDQRFSDRLPTDLRVVLQWDQNDVDMDLWVTDPRGERCMYNHRETEAGGWMSRDFTGGYGPEEFMIKKAIPGTYKVEVNYYGNRRQELSRPVLVQLRLIEDYGKPSQSEQSITRELAEQSGTITIGEFEVE